MRSTELADLHWTEVLLDGSIQNGHVGEIYLASFRTKEKREKAIPLSNMAVEIFRKIERRPDDPCVFGRGDGRPIELDGVLWKEGLFLGDTVRKITKRLKRGPIGFWTHFKRPRTGKAYPVSDRPEPGHRYLISNQIKKQEGISDRTLKAIEASMKAGEPIPRRSPRRRWPRGRCTTSVAPSEQGWAKSVSTIVSASVSWGILILLAARLRRLMLGMLSGVKRLPL